MRGAVATVMAANRLHSPDLEKEELTPTQQMRGAVTTVMAANRLNSPQEKEENIATHPGRKWYFNFFSRPNFCISSQKSCIVCLLGK